MRKTSWAVVAGLAGLAMASACGDEVEPAPEEAGSGGSATGATPEGGSGNEGGSQGFTDECGPGAINQEDPCELCIASQCTAEALACCMHEGCLDVVRCAAENGCSGIDCYAPEKCQAEIDAAGIDVAQEYAAALGACAVESCQTECLPEGAGGAGAGGGP
jgi:hypothetical protein